jgi:hypothetical protein
MAIAVAVGVNETIGLAEAVGMLVAKGEGAGCEVHALRSKRDRVNESRRAFMRAIMAETASRVKRTPSVDMPLPVCYTPHPGGES